MATDISKKQYISTYLFLVKKAKSENIEDIFTFIASSDVKDSTRLNYLNSIIGLKKLDPNLVKGDLSHIIDFRDKLGTKVDKSRKKDNLNENQRKVYEQVSSKSIEDLIEKLKGEKATDTKALEEYILLRLMYPKPFRNDLMDVEICKQKGMLKQRNCIYLPAKKDSKGIIAIVEHKTSSRNGKPLTRELDADLTNDIKTLVKKTDRKYLFQNGKDKPYSSSAFSHKLNSLFKKHLGTPFSSTMMRKIYLTNKYKDVMEEMEEDAQDMGHSKETAQKVYIDNKK
jgi:hypothetical protein